MSRLVLIAGPHDVTAVMLGSVQHEANVAVTPSENGGAVEAAAVAIGQLAQRLEAVAGSRFPREVITLLLMPPFADARIVELPPIARRDAEMVLQRDASRYFLGAESRTVAVDGDRTDKTPGLRKYIAYAASTATMDAFRSAIESAGWQVGRVVPAHAAWLHAARTGGADAVLAIQDGLIHLIGRGTDGQVVRRVAFDRASELTSSIAAQSKILVAGDTATAKTALHDAQQIVGSLDRFAVAKAATGTPTELSTPLIQAQRVHRQQKTAARLAAAAAVLVLATGFVAWWGAHREVDAVQARRAEIQPRVAPLLARVDSIMDLNDDIAQTRELAGRGRRWTPVLLDLAVLLPNDAHLTSMRTEGDTIRIEGVAPRASEAVRALRSARSLENVQLAAPIEREIDDGVTSAERFSVLARLANPSANVTREVSSTERTERRPGRS